MLPLPALGALLPELREADWFLGAAAASALVFAGGVATLMAARSVMAIPPARALQG